MESRQINEVGAPMEVRARSLPPQASSILDALDGPADVEERPEWRVIPRLACRRRQLTPLERGLE